MTLYRNTTTQAKYTKDEWKYNQKTTVRDYCDGKILSDNELEKSFQLALETGEIELDI